MSENRQAKHMRCHWWGDFLISVGFPRNYIGRIMSGLNFQTVFSAENGSSKLRPIVPNCKMIGFYNRNV